MSSSTADAANSIGGVGGGVSSMIQPDSTIKQPPQQLPPQQIAIQQKSGTATFPINLASAKIAHVKSSTMDAIKVAPTVVQSGQQQTATFRTISSGPTPQVRLVMPISQQAMLKQIDTGGGVRAQITAIPARTLSQTSITVTRPITPRSGVAAAANIQAQVTAATNIQAQRLATPLRTPTPPTVAGSFVRGASIGRNTNSPSTTVISPTNATWMAATGGTGQVQLIRAINHNPRQRLISQNITSATTSVGQTITVASAAAAQQGQQTVGQQPNSGNIQTSQQQTFVATVLPRQQTATLVYSNVANAQQNQQTNQFTPNVVAATSGATAQRITVAATSLGSATGNQRQMRPIQLNRTFTTTKLGVGGMNTTNLSIRAPSINQILTSTLNAGGTTIATAGGIGTTSIGRTSATANVPSNLPTTRIIQLQQGNQGNGTGQSGRITSNLMLQPIIMNTSTGGKIGIRPPTTVGSKIQPSLTITQLGLGKLTAAGTQQVQGSTISQSGVTSSSIAASTTMATQQQTTPQTVTVNVSQQQPITQIVSVNQQQLNTSGQQQIITTQNIPASATVVPLAITSKGTNVFTGTITPIKSSAGQITKQQHPITEIITSSQQGNQSNVFIHRPSSGSGNVVVSSTGPSNSTFLPAGGTFYYESVPANQVSTGVLSLTTTTVTSTNTQTVTSTNLTTGIMTSIPYTPGGTFTVVPSNSNSGNRIGQIQIPVSSTTQNVGGTLNQIQAVPIRFNPQQHISSSSDQPTVTVTAQAAGSTPIQPHQLITMPTQSQLGQQFTATSTTNANQSSTTHMLIPVQTAIKLPPGTTASPSPSRQQQQQHPHMQQQQQQSNTVNVTAFPTRKRDNDGSPIRAAKNLQPALLSMSSNLSGSSGPQTVQVTASQLNSLIADQQRNKIACEQQQQQLQQHQQQSQQQQQQRAMSPVSRPPSSDGSTTVSANSSPGVDQQINEELAPMNRVSNDSHFNPINEMYSNHQNIIPSSICRQQEQPQPYQNTTTNGNLEVTPRKKPRRSTNDSQNSASSLYQQQQQHQQQHLNAQQQLPQQQQQQQHQQIPPQLPSQQQSQPQLQYQQSNHHNQISFSNNLQIQENNKINNNIVNKENAKPVTEFIIKKPRTNILDTYKQTWKSANNHFQRYSDVKPREERRQTVMDLANQANVIEKINGWKVLHLGSTMEDLCESEKQVFDTLNDLLRKFEIHGKSPDVDRVSELIKGNIQRSKIITDGVNEARLQVMKIFEHKTNVKDIIHRCASKRNFKKRDKT